MEDCCEPKPNKGTAAIDRHRRQHRLLLLRRRDEDKPPTTDDEAAKRRKFLDNGGEETVRSTAGSAAQAKPAAEDGACLSLESSSPESSCCSSNESSDVKDGLKRVDLEVKSNPKSPVTNNKFRETTPSSELCAGAEEITILPSPAKKKFPPREEIEEFFAEAEKLNQKRFVEKYNYDIANDLPLEGRYEWVSLKR